MSHSRDDETGHVFSEGACRCGLELKDPNVGLDLIPGHSGNQRFDPAPPGGAVVGSIYTQFECGCRIELRPGDPPIRAFECEHGNSIRAQDPPTGQEVYEYEKWLQEGHCPTCGRLRTEPMPEGWSCTGCSGSSEDVWIDFKGSRSSPPLRTTPTQPDNEEWG